MRHLIPSNVNKWVSSKEVKVVALSVKTSQGTPTLAKNRTSPSATPTVCMLFKGTASGNRVV